MKTKSRDDKFIISASDSSKTGCSGISLGEDEATKYDKKNDVYLKAVKRVNLKDVADAIEFDCFSFDSCGLRLLAKTLYCHVTVGNKTYHFTVREDDTYQPDAVLVKIAKQLKL